MIRSLFFCSLLFAICSPASAQNALILAKLAEWDSAAPAPSEGVLEDEIAKTAKAIYEQKAGCTQLNVQIVSVESATANAFVFTAVLNMRMRNAWTIVAQLPGCDPAPVRFMTMQAMDDGLRTIRVNRGTSYAWDSLIGDVLPAARIAAIATLKREGLGCELDSKSTLGVVRIDAEAEDLGPDVFGVRYVGSWSEVWPIHVCDETVEVIANFTADGDGGAYHRFKGSESKILPK